jgi:ankyrin repeat protein
MALRVLCRAIEDFEWMLCEQLIELVEDTSELDALSMVSPILQACLHNCSQKLFQKIVSKSSDLSRHDEQGYTALHRAVMRNQLMWVRVLVSREEIIGAGRIRFLENTTTWHGMGCFQLAVLRGHHKVVSFLLEHGIGEINEATEKIV